MPIWSPAFQPTKFQHPLALKKSHVLDGSLYLSDELRAWTNVHLDWLQKGEGEGEGEAPAALTITSA